MKKDVQSSQLQLKSLQEAKAALLSDQEKLKEEKK